MTTTRSGKYKKRYQKNKEKERERSKKYYQEHKEEIRNKAKSKRKNRTQSEIDREKEAHSKWHAEHRDQEIKKMSERHHRLRHLALEHYGNKCSCCGETEPKFLAIDHVGGGGNNHRRAIGRDGHSLYEWLRKNDYPPGFQVLCHNCNVSKGLYGECPHKTNR